MPVIKKPNQHFDATTYTGNGGTQSITSLGFQPDFVWGKSRSNATSNFLYDAVRGVYKRLISDSTAAETDETGGGLSSFNSDGFTVQANSTENGNARTFVAWNWKAGGAAVANTSGSISSQVSVNSTAGFSVVTWTGNGTIGATVGHGLGVAPSMFIVKQRSSAGESWATYHISLGATKYLDLNSTGAVATSISRWNNTAPTSSVFSLYNDSATNGNTSTYVAYCFAPIAGYSAFGSYTGNGSTDGPFIYTGFKPKFILLKCTASGNNWEIFDTSRNTYNRADLLLLPSTSDAESAAYGSYYVDFLSNGFKIRGSGVGFNGSGEGMIYAAFAEAPFKYSSAR